MTVYVRAPRTEYGGKAYMHTSMHDMDESLLCTWCVIFFCGAMGNHRRGTPPALHEGHLSHHGEYNCTRHAKTNVMSFCCTGGKFLMSGIMNQVIFFKVLWEVSNIL